MSMFIQPLESRRLLSGTKADLLADQAALLSLNTQAKAELRSIVASYSADTRLIAAALRGGDKSNKPLLAALNTSESRFKKALSRSTAGLFNPGVSLGKRSVKNGIALLKKSSPGLLATASRNLAALSTITVAPLATLQTNLASTAVAADLEALVNANPTNAALTAAVAQFTADFAPHSAALGSDGMQFQTAIGALGADLASVASFVTTVPDIRGSYAGTVTRLRGSGAGRVLSITMDLISESLSGDLTGTAAFVGIGGSSSATGQVKAGGAFSLQIDASFGIVTLTGTASGTGIGATITGTYRTTTTSGTFTITRVA